MTEWQFITGAAVVAFIAWLIVKDRKTSPLPHVLKDGRTVDIPVMDGETLEHNSSEARRILKGQERN